MATQTNDATDIFTWLEEKNLGQLVDQFKQRKITLSELCDFELDDLKFKYLHAHIHTESSNGIEQIIRYWLWFGQF